MLNKVALLKCSWVGLAALVLGAGCQAQVGEDYRGEVLLRVQGSVVIDDADAAGLVPVLAFEGRDSMVLLDARVTGVFPSRFRMDVTDAPPASTFTSFGGVGGEPGPLIARGFIALVPNSHPNEVLDATDSGGSADCSADFSVCTYSEELCTGAGACIHRERTCSYEACPVIAETDLPKGRLWEPGSVNAETTSDAALEASESCDDAGECRRVFRKCEARFGRLVDISPGLNETCETTAVTGDDPLRALEELRKATIGYSVMYVPVAGDFPIYGQLSAGYHVFEQLRPESDQTWVDGFDCRMNDPYDTSCAPGPRERAVSPDEELTLHIRTR